MIVGFYKDTRIAPTDMRKAMTNSYTCRGTSAPEGVKGLSHYGIAAAWGALTPSEVIAKLGKNIPVDIAVKYSYIPSRYKQDQGFTGLHSVLACKRADRSGVKGILVRDPDRWGAGKVPYIFWPDNVWMPAFRAANSIAVWPTRAKVIAPTVVLPYGSYKYSKTVEVLSTSLNVRDKPYVTGTKVGSLPKGAKKITVLRTDKGGAYKTPTGGTSTSWVAYKGSDGKYKWVALRYLKVY
jgi:hypothetical protein